jgi:hypothetical protein
MIGFSRTVSGEGQFGVASGLHGLKMFEDKADDGIRRRFSCLFATRTAHCDSSVEDVFQDAFRAIIRAAQQRVTE